MHQRGEGQYLTESEVLSHLVDQMLPEDRPYYDKWGHRWIESAFVDRLFYVVKLNREGELPRIMSTWRVADVQFDGQTGGSCTLVNEADDIRQVVTHVPARLWKHGIFVQMPQNVTLKYELKRVGQAMLSSVSFGLVFKTKNKFDFRTPNNTYILTYRQLIQAYPGIAPLLDVR